MKKTILLSINLLIINILTFGQFTPTSSSVLIEPNNTNGILSQNSVMVSYDAYLSQPLAASGGGTRLMWIPAKSAFRAGTVLSTNWDASNIGTWSFAAGYNTLASARSATAFGNQTNATQQYATAFGTQTTASGFASTAMGETTTASGSSSVATGGQTTASSAYSFAAGQETVASGFRSAAFGWQTNASGTSSFALGASTTASGNHATSMGNTTIASGENAVAMGEGTTALAYSSLAVGTYNDEIYTSSATSSNPTDPLFILGNGTDNNNRSNAMMVLKNGNVGIGTNAPNDKLTVKTISNSFGFSHTDGTVSISSYIPNILGVTAGAFGTKSNHSLILMSNGMYQAYLLSNGNLGIGIATPAEKLEVNGNVRIDNLAGVGIRNVSVDANGKLTTDAQTYKMSVPPVAFNPVANGFGDVPIIAKSIGTNGGVYIHTNQTFETLAYAKIYLSAPLNLPDSAVISSIKGYIINNTSCTVSYELVRKGFNTTTEEILKTVSNTIFNSSNINTLNFDASGIRIDNDYAYYINLKSTAPAGNSCAFFANNIQTHGVKITYTK